MHRAVRVGEYWNWLPAFRAVAETSSLRDAAERIHVAPSAISRTVRLLEESLGKPLFDRTGGVLVLNAAGRELLDAVRSAMRLVNAAQDDSPHDGPCHIYCPTDLVPLMLDALETWLADNPKSPPLVHVPCAEDVAAQILRGDLDVALAFEAATQAGVASVVLGELTSSIYAAPSSPAAKLDRVGAEEIATFSFIDYPVGELAFLRFMDDRERQCIAYVPTMALAVRLCARGNGVVCVPDFVVRDVGIPLARLPWELPLARLYAWFRRPLGAGVRPAIVEHLIAHPAFSTLATAPASASPPPPKRAKRAPRATR